MKRNWFFCSAVVGLVLLGGCAHFEKRILDPQANLAAFETRSLSDPGLQAFMHKTRPDADVSKGWNAADLTLAAFYFQPQLAAARANWEAAVAGIGQAGERPNPTLSVVPAFNTTSPSDISPWVVGATLDFPLDYSGKRTARVAEAEALARSGRLQFIQTAWDTRVQVRSGLLAVYAAHQQAALAHQRGDLLAQLVNLVERKQTLGGVGQLEVSEIKQRQSAAQLEWMKAQRQASVATAQLAATIGVPVAALKSVSLDFTAFDTLPEQAPVSEVCRQALFNRADILGQLADYEAAQARLKLEVARQYPDLSIGPGYEFDQGDHKWGLGVSLSLPLLNHNQGAIEVASRRREEAAAQFNALQTRVLGELNAAMANYDYSVRELRTAHEIKRQAETHFQLLKKQAAAGAVSHGNLIGGQLVLSEAEGQVLEAEFGAQQALGGLERELQSPADLPGWQAALKEAMDRNEESHETK